MSRSLNKVELIGNVGSDPEIRSTTGGNTVAQFSLATSRTWNDQAGVRQEKTEWHRCVVWNSKSSSLADIVERYVKKGDKLYIEGRIEYRQWQDKDGQTRYSTEINVRELLLLGGPRGERGDEGAEGTSAEPRPARAAATPRPAMAASAPAVALAPGETPNCPKCGGDMWDNRATKRNPKAPDFKCKDKGCDGVVWPPRDGAVSAPSLASAPARTPAAAATGRDEFSDFGTGDSEDDDLPF